MILPALFCLCLGRSGEFRPVSSKIIDGKIMGKSCQKNVSRFAEISECKFQPDIFALWLMDFAGATGAADLRHLHAVLWLRDFPRTPTDDLHKVLRLAARSYEPEMMRLDEADYGEQLNVFRTLPTLFSRPAATAK